MRSAAFAVLGAAALLATTAPARADEGGYGERILAIDATSDALIIAGIFAENEWPAYAGLAGHVLGGPIVHLVHDNPAGAALSLGTRVGLPVLTGYLGHLICVDDGDGFLSCLGSTAVGFAIGMVAAQLIDPTFIVPDADTAPAMLTFRF